MKGRTRHTLQIAVTLFLGLSVGSFSQDLDWESHFDPEYGNRYEIPAGMFEKVESEPGKLVFEEVNQGGARLMVYSGDVPSNMTLGEFEDRVRGADWIGDITYRAGERTWFVLSGRYRTEGNEEEPLIFYTKFMLSPDRQRYSAIEVTYQAGRKLEFDPIVTRLEKGLRPPP